MPTAVIVDDSIVARALLRRRLRPCGWVVVAEGTSGEDVIPLYEAHRPDVVLLDVVMPGMDGVQAAGDLLSRYPDARVVMCTSITSGKTTEACQAIGAYAYLPKPVGAEHLASVLQALVPRPSRCS